MNNESNKVKRKIHKPEGGWKPETFYVVEVSFNESNPIHLDVFYTGFVNAGEPAGYNQFVFAEQNLSSALYVKPIKMLTSFDAYNKNGLFGNLPRILKTPLGIVESGEEL